VGGDGGHAVSVPPCKLLCVPLALAVAGAWPTVERRWPPAAKLADAEPPLCLSLHVDGTDHDLEDGREARLAIAGKDVRVRVVVKPTRRFDAAGVQFDFPRDMAFASSAEAGLETWTLDGDDCVIHVYRQAGAADAGRFAERMLAQINAALNESAPKATPHRLDLGGTLHAGTRQHLTLAGGSVQIELTAVGLDVEDGAVVVLVQETLGEGGSASAEGKRLRQLLARTFVAGKK